VAAPATYTARREANAARREAMRTLL
jgi:hypothetical protein